MADIKRGFEWRLYRNTGTYAIPVWNEVDEAGDIDLPLKKDEIEMNLRRNRGVKTVLSGMSDWPIEFDLAHEPAQEDFIAIRDAYLNGTTIDFAVADGNIATPGTFYVRAVCEVIEFPFSPKMKDGDVIKVKAKPSANSTNAPITVTVV